MNTNTLIAILFTLFFVSVVITGFLEDQTNKQELKYYAESCMKQNMVLQKNGNEIKCVKS